MMRATSVWIFLVLIVSLMESKIIDLSHTHKPDTFMSMHGSPGYNLSNLMKGEINPGVYVELNYYGSSEHGGTHIDAPSHFVKGGKTLDEIPIENAIAEGVMIDCTQEAARDFSYSVPLQKLLDWESENGQIPEAAAVLFNFGWSVYYLDEKLYRGSTNLSDMTTYVFPTVSNQAGRWLWDNKKIKMIGTDTASPDPFQIDGKSSGFPLHIYFLPREVIIIENLRDLHRLPPRNFRLHATPVKYFKATGAQTRVYAMTYEDMGDAASMVSISPFLSILILLFRVVVLS